MDRELLKQCVTFHGASLFKKLQCEQTENPDFQAAAADLSKATQEGKAEKNSTSSLVEQFIARKADLLFCPSWRISKPQRPEYEEEEATEPYAIMPPLELFMEVPYDERRAMLYRDLERGDIVVGRINNIREYGFFLTLLCTAGGLKRDIEDLDLSALCHIREIPTTGSHDDPLSYYQIGDFIRAGVKDIDRYQEKITVSLHQAALSPGLEHIKLGVVTREELPVHYSRSLRAANDSTETYERIMSGCHGYQNPCVVDYLLERAGVSDTQPPSLMRGLQSKLFQEDDFATSIRKKQSASWALKCVRAGVDHFKNGRHVEAMNEYNKALDIDTNNVEALVARGALYANKGSILKAISDFELALENCPDHRNAKKYLSQTLVERGRQLEEQEKLVTAEGLYRRALSLDETNTEAQDALNKITETIQKSIRLREEAMAKEKEQVQTKNSQTSADKLRKILKDEKRMKKKRKRSTSSSSTSSSSSNSSSSSSSSSSRRKSRKKKKKKKHRSSKRHRRISSKESRKSDQGKRSKQDEEEEEWYPAPPITSATFLNQKGGPGFAVKDVFTKAKFSQDRRVSISDEERKQDGGSPGYKDNNNRRSSDAKRRDSAEARRRISTSSVDSEHSRRSSFPSEYPKYARSDSSRRSSLEIGRYERGNGEKASSSSSSSNVKTEDSTRQDKAKKDLPANLLDIFSQIEQFEKEKGVKPKT
ncbi:tetratricopeptide repeat protein 14 isoform X1 [Periophthalmus magnuspinnatus]|uniref:tetratricopeptide repeat protein 14 isoform X1 n=1 Tax=Periophthalmus magnuspinnatus TaxID=409849 RepID=UPI00145A35FD|nr:tetratricopeptide repeat protein 14 isoform X1 [Periophthalmus magnuspinnatus]